MMIFKFVAIAALMGLEGLESTAMDTLGILQPTMCKLLGLLTSKYDSLPADKQQHMDVV